MSKSKKSVSLNKTVQSINEFVSHEFTLPISKRPLSSIEKIKIVAGNFFYDWVEQLKKNEPESGAIFFDKFFGKNYHAHGLEIVEDVIAKSYTLMAKLASFIDDDMCKQFGLFKKFEACDFHLTEYNGLEFKVNLYLTNQFGTVLAQPITLTPEVTLASSIFGKSYDLHTFKAGAGDVGIKVNCEFDVEAFKDTFQLPDNPVDLNEYVDDIVKFLSRLDEKINGMLHSALIHFDEDEHRGEICKFCRQFGNRDHRCDPLYPAELGEDDNYDEFIKPIIKEFKFDRCNCENNSSAFWIIRYTPGEDKVFQLLFNEMNEKFIDAAISELLGSEDAE